MWNISNIFNIYTLQGSFVSYSKLIGVMHLNFLEFHLLVSLEDIPL